MIKFAYARDGLSHYILDDGTWEGTEEDAMRFPMVDIGYDEDDVNLEAEFTRRGFKVR